MVAMAKEDNGSLTAKLARWRAWVQAAFLLVWLTPTVRIHTVCSPVFHCYSCPLATFACPIGVLANFSALHLIPLMAIGTLLVVGVVFGSFVCGWACPFGFLQDLVGRIPTPKFELPGWMGYFRYVVLVVFVLIIPYVLGEDSPLFFCRLCPAGALEAAIPNTVESALAGGELALPSKIKMVILALFLLAMFVKWRPWCTLFCPLGAIYGLLSHVSVFFLRFKPESCTDCELCRDLCRYGGRSERRASDQRCIRCMECTTCKAISVDNVFVPSSDVNVL